MPAPIADIGFTEVATGGSNPLVDIVLVHGLQGHPKETWCEQSTSRFWPCESLSRSFPRARILVYGYDSKVSHFFSGPANKNSFLDHARNLLLDLKGVRSVNPMRPLLFICHSLGGILVKDVLRRCEPGREHHNFEWRESIFGSTIGIIFMGTPHRGGNYGSLGKAAERIVRYLGFDTNDSVLRDLRGNSTSFEIIHEEFLRILNNRIPLLPIYSFQEEEGLAGVKGMNGKVVDDESSKLGYCYETVATLPGNHREMCRFDVVTSRHFGIMDGIGYFRLKEAVKTYIGNIRESSRAVGVSGQQGPVMQLPLKRDPHFIGRENELRRLEGLLSDEFSEYAIVGLGGVGVCVPPTAGGECMSGAGAQTFHILAARSAPRIEQGLKDIAKALAIYQVDVLPAIRDWFCSEQSGKWLIIIDNADDEDIFFGDLFHCKSEPKRLRLCDFLPKKQGCGILYTSRNKTSAHRLTSRTSVANILTVNPMETEEAVKLVENGLRGTLDPKHLESIRECTEQLVETLDGLPLALVQAIAMMRENDQEIGDPKAYLELYNQVKEDQQRFLEEHFVDWRRDSDLPNSVFLSWKLSLEQLRRRDKNTVDLLSLMSTLDRQSIPEWLLAFHPEISRYARVKSLGLLHSFSFITPQQSNSKSKKWQMHRLVQVATHAWIRRDGLEQSIRKSLKMLAEAFMGHLFNIEDSELRLKRSLEYYPHAKSVVSLLQSAGIQRQPERSVVNSTDGLADQLDHLEVPLVEETMNDFSGQFRSGDRQDTRRNIIFAFRQISEGNFDAIEEVIAFVDNVRRGSGAWFRYNGVQPLVSRPIYGEPGAEDSDPFEEADPEVAAAQTSRVSHIYYGI